MGVANIRGGGGMRDCVVRHHLVAGRIVVEVRERGHTLGVMKPHDIVRWIPFEKESLSRRMIKWVEFHLRKEERVGGDSIDSSRLERT